jgi:hypothetical protein
MAAQISTAMITEIMRIGREVREMNKELQPCPCCGETMPEPGKELCKKCSITHSDELMHCPFCGSEDVEMDYPIDGTIKCHDCDIEVTCFNESKLFHKWNTRI